MNVGRGLLGSQGVKKKNPLQHHSNIFIQLSPTLIRCCNHPERFKDIWIHLQRFWFKLVWSRARVLGILRAPQVTTMYIPDYFYLKPRLSAISFEIPLETRPKDCWLFATSKTLELIFSSIAYSFWTTESKNVKYNTIDNKVYVTCLLH